MTYKQVLFESAAREKVVRGATQLASAVRITLGPKSKSVLIQKKWGAPLEDADLAHLARYLGTHFPVDLPAPALRSVAPPPGAMPASP